MGKVSGDVPEEIVRAAMKEPTLRGRVILRSTRRHPLICDGKVVGFVTPHETKSGWRIGPIYVAPGYRRRGLVAAYYQAQPGKAFVAFIADGNAASLSAHRAAGFVAWKKARHGQWLRREAVR